MLDDTFGDDAANYVKPIMRAATRGSELTRRLLAFSRQQTLEPAIFDIDTLMADMKGLLNRTLAESIDLQISVADDTWPVIVDSGQMENALLNLAINAQHAMPQGGVLQIGARNVTFTDVEGAPADQAAGDFVEISVRDSGHGISDDFIDRIFEPFFTTKEVGQGSGLGLSMVYGFVKQSKGHVTVDSKVGVGTTIRLFLPRTERPVTIDAGSPVTDRCPTTSARESILVVEDDADVRAVVVNMLENLGYAVTEAEDGNAALTALDRSADYDLLLSDVVMPGDLSGVELMQTVRRDYPGLAILLMSGYADSELTKHSLPDDAEILFKPFERSQLGGRIRAMLHGD